MTVPTGTADVLLRTEGRAGFVTLNRPRALNALTHAMVLAVDEALTAWEHDPAVETVVIDGAGERGLCAGGDIRAIHDDARAGGTASAAFWRDEYRLNARIARYPKPYVALMDGIVMGGGVGISAHGSHRVVTERSRVAMPETGIGFVPDVGGTYLLGRAPGELGTHLALTGTPVGAADAILAGLADRYVPAAGLPALADDLTRLPAGEASPATPPRPRPVPWPDSGSGSTPATPPRPSRRSSSASSTPASPPPRRRPPPSSRGPRAPSRRPWPSSAAPGPSPPWKRSWTWSTAPPAPPWPPPTSSRASAPR